MKEAKKSSRRIGKSIKVPDLGQTRRTILGKTGMALVVGLGTVLTSRISRASPLESDLKNRPAETTPVKPKLSPPTCAEIMQLVEYLTHLGNLPEGAVVFHASERIRPMMKILDSRDLAATLEAARRIRGYGCHYGIGSTRLSDDSRSHFAQLTIPICQALEAELAAFEVRRTRESG